MRAWFSRILISLLISTGIIFFSLITLFNNRYDIYASNRVLAWSAALLVPVTGVIYLLLSKWLAPVWQSFDRKKRLSILLMTAGFLAAALFVLPPPNPDLPQTHTLTISSLGTNRWPSTGTRVEIKELLFYNLETPTAA